jgi:hypothetical protein
MRHCLKTAILILIVTVSLNAQNAERGRTPVVAYGVTGPIVTATESQNQLRFTALALAQKIRLEVLSQAGEPVFDSGFQPGNRFEWSVKDQQGSGLRDGVYGCLVTLADLNGQMSHRWATFRVKEGAATFVKANEEAEARATDEVENLTILRAEEPSPFTLVSHDGKEGWIESASGGLSFYAGSLSRNGDAVPHLRLTPEGNLGIGVAEPQAKVDVAGLVRASEGFQFSDGTVLKMEGGFPVLLIDTRQGASDSQTGSGTTISSTSSSAGSGTKSVRLMAAARGGPGRVDAWEGASNTFFGTDAGNGTMSGLYNSFFGVDSGSTTTTGTGNSAFGWGAAKSNSTGNDNSIFGAGAGYNNAASNNSFFGQNAGNTNSDGGNNSFFGRYAGYTNVSGSDNSFFGKDAGKSNTASGNSFFGSGAGSSNNTGHGNAFFGTGSGSANTWNYNNSFFGNSAGLNNQGDWNTFVGFEAGKTQGGFQNSFFGAHAGYSTTTGGWNCFFGDFAGDGNSTGDQNTFVGSSAGAWSDTGEGNSYFGANAGNGNGNKGTGDYNSFFGTQAGLYQKSGAHNAFFGFSAGYLNTAGSSNTIIGDSAGSSNTIENYNSFLGSNSDGNAGITNATAIGYRAKVTQSNSLVLGSINGVNGADADTNVGMGTTRPNYRLHIYHTGTYPRIYIQGDTGKYPGFQLGFDSAGSRVALVRAVEQDTNGTALQFYTRNNASAMVQGMVINDVGNVGIGTSNPTERLQIAGNLKVSGMILYGAPEIELPDYVFESNYDLMPIQELERFVAREKHLPNVPKASEIREKGLNLSDFQMKLLEKIEELTLYTAQQARALDRKDTEISALKSKNAILDARLATVEQILEHILGPEERKVSK